MKIIKKLVIITIIILVSIILNATIFTRDDIIATANSYLRITSWSPKKDTLIISNTDTFFSWYSTEKSYTVMPYTFGRYDNITRFINNINKGKVPGGQGTSNLSWTVRDTRMAGIDCAGYVMRCWAFPDTDRYISWRELINVSMKIENNKTKRGDWINKITKIVGTDTTTHQLLCESKIDNNHFNVYESTSDIDINNINDYPGVKYSSNKKITKFNAYSIFPQFSNPKPDIMEIVHIEEGMETEIELTIRASGDINNTEFTLTIDDNEIQDYIIGEVSRNETDNYTEYRLVCNYVFEEEGLHRVKVKAGNEKSNNIYVDEYEWEFFTGKDEYEIYMNPDYACLKEGESIEQGIYFSYFPRLVNNVV